MNYLENLYNEIVSVNENNFKDLKEKLERHSDDLAIYMRIGEHLKNPIFSKIHKTRVPLGDYENQITKDKELLDILKNDDPVRFSDYILLQLQRSPRLLLKTHTVIATIVYFGAVECYRVYKGFISNKKLMFTEPFEKMIVAGRNLEMFHLLESERKISYQNLVMDEIRYQHTEFLDYVLENDLILKSLIKIGNPFRGFSKYPLSKEALSKVKPRYPIKISWVSEKNIKRLKIEKPSEQTENVQMDKTEKPSEKPSEQTEKVPQKPQDEKEIEKEKTRKILMRFLGEAISSCNIPAIRKILTFAETKGFDLKTISFSAFYCADCYPIVDVLSEEGFNFESPRVTNIRNLFESVIQFVKFETFRKIFEFNQPIEFSGILSSLLKISLSANPRNIQFKSNWYRNITPVDFQEKVDFLINFYGTEKIIETYPFDRFKNLFYSLENNYVFWVVLKLAKIYSRQLSDKYFGFIYETYSKMNPSVKSKELWRKHFKILCKQLIKNGYKLTVLDSQLYHSLQ